jgi:hypothetical protein
MTFESVVGQAFASWYMDSQCGKEIAVRDKDWSGGLLECGKKWAMLLVSKETELERMRTLETSSAEVHREASNSSPTRYRDETARTIALESENAQLKRQLKKLGEVSGSVSEATTIPHSRHARPSTSQATHLSGEVNVR